MENLENDMFIRFSALPCAQTLSIESWNSAIVDQIIFEGDKMYLNAFERRFLPGTDALSLVYLPDRARSLPIDAQRNSLSIEVTTSPNQWSRHKFVWPHFSVPIIAINNDIN